MKMMRFSWMAALVVGLLASTSIAHALEEKTPSKVKPQVKAQPTPASPIIYFHDDAKGHDHASQDIQNLLPNYKFTPSIDVGENVTTVRAQTPAGLVDSFTPRRANAHLGFVYDKTAASKDTVLSLDSKPGFGVGLSSSVKQANALGKVTTGNLMLDEALRYESYELGLNVGYAGFSFDASLYKELGGLPEAPLGEAMQGYDLGLSFNRPTWSTSMSVGSYTSLKDEFLAINEEGFQNSMTAFNVGAVYRPWPYLHLAGGVRYLNLAEGPLYFGPHARQMIYFGTRLKF